jgi:hypothetical protein
MSAGRIPALQGGSRRPGQWPTWLTSSWSTAALMATGAAILIAGAAAARGRLVTSNALGEAPGSLVFDGAPMNTTDC